MSDFNGLLNTVTQGDCLDVMERIPDGSVDITITSPPYNLGIDYGSYKDELPFDEYVNFMENVFNLVYQKTKKGGRVCINVPPDIGVLKDNTKTSLDAVFYNVLTEKGFKYRTKIVWNKNQITSRTAWGSFKSPSNPNILPPFEYVLVFYKETPKKDGSKENIDITKEEFIEWTNGLWTLAPESKKKIGHPAPYPITLCERLLKMFSYKGDVALDPFIGSGTTAVAAINTNRQFIGIEKESEYVEIAKRRIDEALTKKGGVTSSDN